MLCDTREYGQKATQIQKYDTHKKCTPSVM